MATKMARSDTVGFFLWVHLKDLVYRDVVTTQNNLFVHLHAACTAMDSALLRHVRSSIPRHAQAFLDMQGTHFEHLAI